jgi:hypothetical protein
VSLYANLVVRADECREHEDLHSVIQDLRVWLELEIPLIEDGNSFGRSSDTLDTIQ